MATDPVTGIRVLDSGVLERPVDQSTASDELAAEAGDWPSKVELSRLRANLLRPLRFGPGRRVLVPDAGTGALARYLGEQGAPVLALEADLERARAADARCDDLAAVEVVCGTVDGLGGDERFDAIVVVGVPDVDGLAPLLADDGALVVAVANQVGLRVLLGWPDDEQGEPWGALEDRAAAVSRRALAERLAGAGLATHRWLYPFPDHVFPKVVLDQSAYERPGAEAFVDQVVGRPVAEGAHPRAVLADDRRAHRVFVRAGLGPEVASSFLVVAARQAAAVERFVDDDVVAWHFGGERMRLWLRSKVIRRADGGGLVVEAAPLDPAEQVHERGWLAQNPASVRSYAEGQTIEQLALDACVLHDRDALAAVLRRWRDHLLEQEDDKAVPAAAAHPLLPESTRAVLPPPYVDVDLGNFVALDDGTLDYIDTEWVVPGGVSTDLASLRALWYFAERLVTSGAEHPWPLAITVDELTQALAGLCDVPASQELLEAWRDAEAQLQAKVIGGEADAIRAHSAAVGRSSRLSPDVVRRLPFTRLRRDVVRMKERNDVLEADAEGRLLLADELRELRARSETVERLDDALKHRELQVENLSAELAAARAELAELHPLLQAAQAEVAAQVGRWDRIERLLPVRVFRKVRRLLA